MRILLPLSSGLISVVVGSVQHLSSDLDSDLADLDYLLDGHFVPTETGAQEFPAEQRVPPIDHQEEQDIGEEFHMSEELWADLLETLEDGTSGNKRKADSSWWPENSGGATSSVGSELSNEACELLEMVVSEIPEIPVVDLRVQFALNRFVEIPSEAAIAAWLGRRKGISLNSAEKDSAADVDLGPVSVDEVEDEINPENVIISSSAADGRIDLGEVSHGVGMGSVDVQDDLCPENVFISSSAADGRTDLSEMLRGFINGDEVDENFMKKLIKEHTVTMPDAYLKILILEIARLGTWKCGRGGTMTKLHEAVSERLAQAKLGILSHAVVERTVRKIRGALTASQGAPEKATYDHKSIVQEVLSSPGAASLQRNDLVNRAVDEFIARGLPIISEFCVRRIVDKCRDELGLMGSSSLPALRRAIISKLPFRLLKREKMYELFRAEWLKQHETEPCSFRTFEPDLRWVRKTNFSARP